MDEIHPNILKKYFLSIFNNVTSLVTRCFMINIVQGSKWIHVGMGRKEKLAKMKVWYLDYSYAIIYFAQKSQNLHLSS